METIGQYFVLMFTEEKNQFLPGAEVTAGSDVEQEGEIDNKITCTRGYFHSPQMKPELQKLIC